jgi:AraC-like DNA-binding protein
MEEWLCRKLEAEEVVHHFNGNRQDNRPTNLRLCANAKEHHRSHPHTWATGRPRPSERDAGLNILLRYVRNGTLSVSTIAARVGVSTTTIYRWIDENCLTAPLASAPLDRFLSEIENEVAVQREREIQTLTGEASNG